MVNSPLIRPYFLGEWHWGAPLGSHDMSWIRFFAAQMLEKTLQLQTEDPASCRDPE